MKRGLEETLWSNNQGTHFRDCWQERDDSSLAMGERTQGEAGRLSGNEDVPIAQEERTVSPADLEGNMVSRVYLGQEDIRRKEMWKCHTEGRVR